MCRRRADMMPVLLGVQSRLRHRMEEVGLERRALQTRMSKAEHQIERFRALLGRCGRLHYEMDQEGPRAERGTGTDAPAARHSLSPKSCLKAGSTGKSGSRNNAAPLLVVGASRVAGLPALDFTGADVLVARLRNAVRYAPVSAVDIFRALAPNGGRLAFADGERLFRILEATAPPCVVVQAFRLLDVNASGFIEETDWMEAIGLPP